MVEIGWVDMCLEVSMMALHVALPREGQMEALMHIFMMALHVALPREGHMEVLLHIFGFLKKYHNTEMVYDPSHPIVDKMQLMMWDWATSEFGHVIKMEITPPNMPELRGFGFTMHAKVESPALVMIGTDQKSDSRL